MCLSSHGPYGYIGYVYGSDLLRWNYFVMIVWSPSLSAVVKCVGQWQAVINSYSFPLCWLVSAERYRICTTNFVVNIWMWSLDDACDMNFVFAKSSYGRSGSKHTFCDFDSFWSYYWWNWSWIETVSYGGCLCRWKLNNSATSTSLDLSTVYAMWDWLISLDSWRGGDDVAFEELIRNRINTSALLLTILYNPGLNWASVTIYAETLFRRYGWQISSQFYVFSALWTVLRPPL